MPRPRILVVDDSRTVRTVIRHILDWAGYEVTSAANGREAIEQVTIARPELLVLDIEMPLMDGYGVCQQLRQMGDPWNRLPIVFLTHVRSHALELLGTKLGAYVAKPVSKDQLLEAVAKFVAPQTAPRDEPVAWAK